MNSNLEMFQERIMRLIQNKRLQSQETTTGSLQQLINALERKSVVPKTTPKPPALTIPSFPKEKTNGEKTKWQIKG